MRENLVKDHTEGVDVGPTVNRLDVAPHLLRRHVDGSSCVPGFLELPFAESRSVRERDSEVENDGLTRGRHHDVSGLQISVNDARPMRDIERPRDVFEQANRASPLPGSARCGRRRLARRNRRRRCTLGVVVENDEKNDCNDSSFFAARSANACASVRPSMNGMTT